MIKLPYHLNPLAFALLLPTVACGGDDVLHVDRDPTELSTGDDTTDGSSESAETTTLPAESSGGDEIEPSCGNGLLELGEACDDGDRNGEPGWCAEDCQAKATWCGDGRVQEGETCDDGNDLDGDGCNTDCRRSGVMIWEHRLDLEGMGRAVDVGPDGAIYAAGWTTTHFESAWATRLDPQDGSTAWTRWYPTPLQSPMPNRFFAVHVVDDDTIAFAGRHANGAQVRLVDPDGETIAALHDPMHHGVDDLVAIPTGYLAKGLDNTAIRYDAMLQPAWTTTVGSGLAYRPGDNDALAAVEGRAGFRRFTVGTLGGIAFAPIEFPVGPGLSVTSDAVAWTSTGEVVVAGQVWGNGSAQALVLQSSSGGDLRWMYGPQQLAGSSRTPHCLAVDSQDAIVVGGQTMVQGEPHPFLMKLSAEGKVLWVRHFGLDAPGFVLGCTTNANDEIIAVGSLDGHIWASMLTP